MKHSSARGAISFNKLCKCTLSIIVNGKAWAKVKFNALKLIRDWTLGQNCSCFVFLLAIVSGWKATSIDFWYVFFAAGEWETKSGDRALPRTFLREFTIFIFKMFIAMFLNKRNKQKAKCNTLLWTINTNVKTYFFKWRTHFEGFAKLTLDWNPHVFLEELSSENQFVC